MVSYALKTAYRDGTTHVVFDRGGLPSLDRDTQSSWPNWQRWCPDLERTNGAAFMPLGAGIEVNVCSAYGGPMNILASIEDSMVIGKILSHLQATSCTPPAGSATCAVGARAPPSRDLLALTRATGARLGMLDDYCTSNKRLGQWPRVID